MNFDLIAAIIALLRADTFVLANGKTIAQTLAVVPLGLPATGARIYGSDVPPDAFFPRCYVHLRRPSTYVNTSNYRDRNDLVNVLFATTAQASPGRTQVDLELMDKRADTLLTMGVTAPNLVFLRREGDDPFKNQSNDRNLYLVGGGIYHGYFQD